MLLLLLLRVPLVASPQKTRKQVLCTRKLMQTCRLGKNTGGDQLARLLHRGVGGFLRVIVQHARVVVGATSYYHGTIHI